MNHEHCTECNARLRPARKTLAELPGTQPHATGGICRPCYNKAYRARRKARQEAEQKITEGIRPREKGISEDFDVNHARYALNSFLSNLPSHRKKTAA